MAQYITDFTEYTTGVAPSDWTSRWHTTLDAEIIESAEFGKLLRVSGGSSNRHALTWDAVEDASRVHILAHLRTDNIVGTSGGGLIGRVLEGTTSSNGSGHVWCSQSGGQRWRYIVYDGTSADVVTQSSFRWNTSTFYWARVILDGTSTQMKVWAGDLTDEPDTWLVDITETRVPGPGKTGLFVFYSTIECDLFAVGTDGDDPPIGPPSSPVELTATLGGLDAAVEVTPQVTATIDAELGGLGATLNISTPAVSPQLLSVLGGLDAEIDTDVTVRAGIDTELGELAATVNTIIADQCIFNMPLGGLDGGLSIDSLTTHPKFTATLGELSVSSQLRSIINDLELAAALGELHAGVGTTISIDWPIWGRLIPTPYTRTYVSEDGQIRVEVPFARFRYVPERDSLASITTSHQPVRVRSTYSPVVVREG